MEQQNKQFTSRDVRTITGVGKTAVCAAIKKILPDLKTTSGKEIVLTSEQFAKVILSPDMRKKNMIEKSTVLKENGTVLKENGTVLKQNGIKFTLECENPEMLEQAIHVLFKPHFAPKTASELVKQETPLELEKQETPLLAEKADLSPLVNMQLEQEAVSKECNAIVKTVIGKRSVYQDMWTAIYAEFKIIASPEARQSLIKRNGVEETAKASMLKRLCAAGHGHELRNMLVSMTAEDWKQFEAKYRIPQV